MNSQLIDPVSRQVAEELCCLRDVQNALGYQSHHSCASGIAGYRVIGENNAIQLPGGSRQRPIAFHAHDSVGDDKMDWHSRHEIDNALLDAMPVQQILRPSIFHTGACGGRMMRLQVANVDVCWVDGLIAPAVAVSSDEA